MRQSSAFLTLALASCMFSPLAVAQHDHHAEDGGTSPSDKPWSQADEIWGAEEMHASREHVLHHHGAGNILAFMLDRAEIVFADEGEIAVIEGDIWYGGDLNKLWVKSEAEYSFDHSEFEEFEVQALWSRAISPYWDFQTGLRYDFESDGLAHAVVGFQGTAPYRFEAFNITRKRY